MSILPGYNLDGEVWLMVTKNKKTKIMNCAASIEQKEHPWASPTIAMRIATDHGAKGYPQCIMTVRDRRKVK